MALTLAFTAAGAKKTGKVYSEFPASAAGDFTVARNSPAYTENADGTLSEVDIDVPKFVWKDGKPAVLREAAATNQIRNNSMVGAVVGTPGTLPTNWSDLLRGLTREVVAIGKIGDVDYIDLKFIGTTNSSGGVFMTPESISQTVATSGQNWAKSCFLQLLDTTIPPNSYEIRIEERTAEAELLTDTRTTISPTTVFKRYETTRLLTNASTARVSTRISFRVNSGESYDFTVRIGMPQMELGTVASSVIKTEATTETRDADNYEVDLPAGTAKVTLTDIDDVETVDSSPADPYVVPVGSWKKIIMED